ncbi:MAG: hypothetical protein ACYCST_16610 [Acidimicrobiales bacterium]
MKLSNTHNGASLTCLLTTVTAGTMVAIGMEKNANLQRWFFAGGLGGLHAIFIIVLLSSHGPTHLLVPLAGVIHAGLPGVDIYKWLTRCAYKEAQPTPSSSWSFRTCWRLSY